MTHWVAGRWSRKTFGAASAASGGRIAARVPCCSPAHCDCSQRLCALDVLVAACEAIRGSPSHTPALEPLLPQPRAAAAGVTKWRSRKLNVVNSAPKSNRFGVIGEFVASPPLKARLHALLSLRRAESFGGRPRHFLPASQRCQQRRRGGAYEAHVSRRRDGSWEMDGVAGQNFAVCSVALLLSSPPIDTTTKTKTVLLLLLLLLSSRPGSHIARPSSCCRNTADVSRMACSCLALCRRSAASADVYVRRCAVYLFACVLSLCTLVDLDEDGGLNVRHLPAACSR